MQHKNSCQHKTSVMIFFWSLDWHIIYDCYDDNLLTRTQVGQKLLLKSQTHNLQKVQWFSDKH